MTRRALLAALFAAILAGTLTPARAVSVQVASSGTFALQGATSHITAQMIATALGSPLAWDLQFSFAHSGARIPITEYDDAGGKPMDLVVVDDAMHSFQHVHPRLDPAGAFHQRITFPRSGYFHLYAATTPSGNERQVFRFDFVGGTLQSRPPPRRLKTAAPGSITVASGPYRVAFIVPSLRGGAPATIAVRLPNGAAHAEATMLSARDLSYTEVKAEALETGELNLHITPRMRGAYTLWLQFTDAGGKPFVAPLALAVQ